MSALTVVAWEFTAAKTGEPAEPGSGGETRIGMPSTAPIVVAPITRDQKLILRCLGMVFSCFGRSTMLQAALATRWHFPMPAKKKCNLSTL
jgi:hypothetical protein